MKAMLLTFLFVFAFNLAPAFTPPTWMVLSYIAVVHHPARLPLAVVGAVPQPAAACCSPDARPGWDAITCSARGRSRMSTSSRTNCAVISG